jgi:hypothetical protein
VIIHKLPRTHNGKVQLSCLKTLWDEKQNLDRVMSLNSTLKVYFYQKIDTAIYTTSKEKSSDTLNTISSTQTEEIKNNIYEMTEQNP